jgi:hypothetical protein
MQRAIVIVMFLSIFQFVPSVLVAAEISEKEGELKAIISRCSIGSDDEYAKILTDLKHSPASVAPPEFRSIIKKLGPFRMDLHWGISWKKNRLTLYWFTGEFGVKKPTADVAELLSGTVESLGFGPSGPDTGKSKPIEFAKVSGDFIHRFRIEKLERFIGTSTPSSGGSFQYEIEYGKDVAEPILEEVLDGYPALACPEMIPGILGFFAPVPVTEVSYGGTWTRYYDFEINADYKDEKLAKKAFSQLKELVVSLGFSFEREDGGILTFMKDGSIGPVLYLSLEKDGIACFRIQPLT